MFSVIESRPVRRVNGDASRIRVRRRPSALPRSHYATSGSFERWAHAEASPEYRRRVAALEACESEPPTCGNCAHRHLRHALGPCDSCTCRGYVRFIVPLMDFVDMSATPGAVGYGDA